MNKYLELEKRFKKVMKGIEKLPLRQPNGVNYSRKNDDFTDPSLPKDKISKLSNRDKELETAAKIDSEQIDKLIIDLQSLLENKDD